MFMRFRGGGIGHKSTWNLNNYLMKDILLDTASNEDSDEEIKDEMSEMNSSDGGDNKSGAESVGSDKNKKDKDGLGYADL